MLGKTTPYSSPAPRLTYRRVEIDEDGAGNVFAAGGLGEEGLVGAILANLVGEVRVVASLGGQTVLEQVPM